MSSRTEESFERMLRNVERDDNNGHLMLGAMVTMALIVEFAPSMSCVCGILVLLNGVVGNGATQ